MFLSTYWRNRTTSRSFNTAELGSPKESRRKSRANLVKGRRTAPAAGCVMRKALRLEGPVGRTGNRQEPPLDQVLARQSEIMFGDPRHLRVCENPAIKVPPLPLRLPR